MIKSGLGSKSSYVVVGVISLCGLAFLQATHDADAKVAGSSTAWQTKRVLQDDPVSAKPRYAAKAVARSMTSAGRRRPVAPIVSQDSQGSTEPEKVEIFDGKGVMHVGRVISSTAVPSSGNAATSRAAGELAIGAACDCDQDCAAGGDACNIVQCIVRSVCSGDNSVPCTTNTECADVGAGSCEADPFGCESNIPPDCNFVQRCAIVQLIDWPCDADADFCTEDRCEDDGFGIGNSVCVAQTDSDGGSPLSPCAKQCVGGPANELRCVQASDCSQGACEITPTGACDSGTEVCYVGPSLALAVGRCCAADGTCTETDKTDCESGGGAWYRYRDPEEQEGDDDCLCPKYASGIAPAGVDSGSSAAFGLVRPSGLMCERGSRQGFGIDLCEDLDGDGLSPNFCQKRCVGGDNEGGTCVLDNPDCARLGFCSIGGTVCEVANEGSDCGICSISGFGCDGTAIQACPDQDDVCEFDVPQLCPPSNPGSCVIDNCVSNDIEGGCEDGFLNIGDDYAVANGFFLRLSQFRFRGGVSNLGEDFVIEFWNTSGTRLVDSFAVNNLDRTGTRDWAIEVDCWPNCNPAQLEVPVQNPIIIPPTGYVVMRSVRTLDTINGAGAFWEQTDDPADVGVNDNTKAWVNGDPNGSLGTNVFIFELVGTKISDPAGACCTDAESCADSLRWECGICSIDGVCAGGANDGNTCKLDADPSDCADPGVCSPTLCSNALNDCPNGILTGNTCEFNNWFGPISHEEIEFGGAELTLCNGISPCDLGACCVGEDCQLLTEEDCDTAGGGFHGLATDCTPNCCPVDVPTGSDCACSTSTCVVDAGGANTGFACEIDMDCELGQSCILQCEPAGVTQLRHPYECFDDFGCTLEPSMACDPANGNADCPPIPCTQDADCPTCIGTCGLDVVGFCDDTSAMTCEQSFTGSFSVARNDTIPDNLFTAIDGDVCSLNSAIDRVGWYELLNLVDPTPGDGTDDCFVITVGLCCTDPVLAPVWPLLSQYINCPCLKDSDVIGILPDVDISGDALGGFGADSKASVAGRCEDGNYSATFTVPPGEYAYQINSDTNCAGSTIPCDDDNDCPGTSCVVLNPDYAVHFTVEPCQIAACCVGATCSLTNELDCLAQEGNFLGGGDQPIVSCQVGACDLGSCCLDGECNDVELDTFAACDAVEGIYIGGLVCGDDPCPACPFNTVANCQQVQTIFGRVPMMDRNPDNYGAGADPVKAGASLHADDVKFGGSTVDTICWNVGFFNEPCCGNGNCDPNIDGTWQIRVYEPDPNCDAFPGPQIGSRSLIGVLNKIEGTGQATGTWHYSGTVQPAITLPNPGLAGDTYWFEISAFGESGCGVRATWSRDHGNEHIAKAVIADENDLRVYEHRFIEAGPDLGFCENSGIATPDTILGSCCTCGGNCDNNVTSRACDLLAGFWIACGDCADITAECVQPPANDDCGSAQVVASVPTSMDGSAFITIGAENICATDDGPGLADGEGGCAGSLTDGADLHDDLWYSYVAEECGDLRIHSCDMSDMDMMIAIYDGTAATCPPTTGDELACDDNDCADFFDTDVTLRVAPGQELLIRVGGWNNEVVGGFDGDPRGSWTTEWSLQTGVCPTVEPPIRAPAPHAFLKNRYISIDPRGEMGINPPNLHIRVMVDSSVVNGQIGNGPWWATQPVNGAGLSPATCISILGPTKPAVEPDWTGCDTVHLTGCPIIPTTTYAIAVESGGELSSETLLDTQAKPGVKWHGDVVGFYTGTEWTGPNGVAGIDDAVAAIKTFQTPGKLPGCGAPPCNATHLSVTDVHPNQNGDQINLQVNLDDVFTIIMGFQLQEFPGMDLTQCPDGGGPSNPACPGAGQCAVFEWVPIDSTGPNTIVDNEITLPSGGQTVTLDLRLSGWGDTIGPPELTAYQATVDSGGYTSGTGDALNPLGWPSTPINGAYIATRVCFLNERPCVAPESDCDLGTEGPCVHNSDFVFLAKNQAFPAVATTTLNYTWGAVASVDSRVDGGMMYHGGLLKVDVPPGASGTYTIDFVNSPNETFMTDSGGGPITPIDRIPALIILPGPDCNDNAIPDSDDIANCTGEPACGDCNFNEIPDECDIADLTSGDCNNNGIPDECEGSSDCNFNQIPDACDIEDLTSDDCDTNAIPDECDIANCDPSADPGCDDCNFNTIPDECDIDVLFSADCNNNGIPDECEDFTIIYVRAGAGGTNSGTSWTHAFFHLQDAFSLVTCAPLAAAEIWVWAGTYYPDDGVEVTPGDRNATFQLVSGTEIYGGFAGFEILREQRNPAINVTILSGDLLGNDSPVACTQDSPDCDFNGGICDGGFCIIDQNNSDNSFHVTTGSGTNATAILDGFTITGGNADGTFLDSDGGAMQNVAGSPTVANCKLNGNSGDRGAAMYNLNSDPTVTNSTFRGNAGFIVGGGMFSESSNPTLINCTFDTNFATDGGGMYNNAFSSPIVTRCTFRDNSAVSNGGGMYNNGGSDPTVTSCIMRGNSATLGGGMYNLGSSSPIVTNSMFEGNFATHAGGMSNDGNSNPLVTNCTFGGNSATGDGGAMRNVTSSPDIVNCILWDNTDAGGMDESAQIHTDSGTPVVNYSIVQGGWTGAGGAGNLSGDPMFVDAGGGNLRIELGSPAIEAGDNTVVPADTADVDGDGDTVEILPIDLDGNRRFVDELLTVDTGMGLPPIVDMGAFEAFRDCDNNGVEDDIELLVLGVVDCNSNSNLDSCDIAECEGDLACGDCNSNGVPDFCDIDSGSSTDCNNEGAGNDIPDECDIADCAPSVDPGCDDCNNNEVLDECDIFVGTSLDNDENDRPDECIAWDGGSRSRRGQNAILVGPSDWSTATNWQGDTLPVNDSSVIIDAAAVASTIVVNLDIPSTVASARLLGRTTLNVTLDDDLTIEIDGIFLQGDTAQNEPSSLNISSGRLVDVITGPITIGAAGVIFSSHTGPNPPMSLMAASIDIRNGACECPPASGGDLTLEGTSIETTGDVVLVSPIGATCTTPCALSRGGTTPPILKATASFATIGGNLTMNAGEVADPTTAPELSILENSNFVVEGNITINDERGASGARGGTTPPILTLNTSILSAIDFTVNGHGGDLFGRGGTTPPILTFMNSTFCASGNFTANGPDRPSAGRGGTTPPILKIFSTAMTIGGDFNLNGDVDLRGSEGRSGDPVTSLQVGGNFNNHSISPATFDLGTNLFIMNGGPIQQTMEAAAQDRGAGTMDYESNYFIGMFEIASSAHVTLSDSFDNDGLGQAVAEVQYVGTLTIQVGGSLIVDNTILYYGELTNNGSLDFMGSGAAHELDPSSPEPCCLRFPNVRCEDLPPIDCAIQGGTVADLPCSEVGDEDGDMVPDFCDTCPRGDDNIDNNENGIPDDCDIESPTVALSPHHIFKNRYISINPRGATGLNTGRDLDIRLTLTSTLVDGVTEVGSSWWANAPDVDCISVVSPIRPVAAPNWDACKILHLTGCPIIPTSTYDIVTIDGSTESASPFAAKTQIMPGVKFHGDVVGAFTGTQWTPPNLQVNIDDAVAAIKTFQFPSKLPGCAVPPCNATHTSVTDVAPNLPPAAPNKIVNIEDVLIIILGFQGNEYPGADLTQCP